MADAFIPASLERISPVMTPAEVAERIAAALGAPALTIRLTSNNTIKAWDASTVSDEAAIEIRYSAADEVIMGLLRDRLPSYVEAATTGRLYRIPLGYWSMKSGAENPWSVLGTLDRFQFAAGYDESMVGQPIIVSGVFGQAFADSVVARLTSSRTRSSAAPPAPPPAPLAPTDRTGAPGQPSSMHIVTIMMRARFKSGEALPTMSLEADELVRLMEADETYAQLAKAKAKTIRNTLGAEYRRLTKQAAQ